MPEVSRADCSVPSSRWSSSYYSSSSSTSGAFDACTNNDLLTRYVEVYPDGALDNLVGACDDWSTTSTSGAHSDDSTTSTTSTTSTDDDSTTSTSITSTDDSTTSTSTTPSDVTEFDFGSCDYNTYMCCWTENNNQGMQDNTVRSTSCTDGVFRKY